MRSCPRCHRANPDEAVYCHHDGILLRGEEIPDHPSGIPDRFPREWVFPSGRRCITREELLEGCLGEWEAAAIAYSTGHLGKFLQEVAGDKWMPPPMEIDTSDDLALQIFLEQIADPDHPPRPVLEVYPRRLQLDVRPDDSPSFMLRISNRGKGFLHGTVNVGMGGLWLQIDMPTGFKQSYTVATRREQTLPIKILGRKLPGTGSFLGKLIVQTNGGTFELPVMANLAGGSTFHGHSINSPRDLAKLLRDKPKDALKWLENGSVARWFSENGQPFPIQGPVAPSLGGIQQLFEALNVSRIPEVRLENREIHLVCQHPEELTESVFLRTSDDKWVYGLLSCNDFWLKLPSDAVSGPKKAEIQFTVDSSLLEAGRVYDTIVHITSNGGQTFRLKVFVDVKRSHVPFSRRIF